MRPDKVEAKQQHNLYSIDYTPRYSWYRKTIAVPAGLQGKEAVITIKKSQYVTQVYINGMDMGTSMACYTPIEFPVSLPLPAVGGGYLLVDEFTDQSGTPIISRRYLKVGEQKEYAFYKMEAAGGWE